MQSCDGPSGWAELSFLHALQEHDVALVAAPAAQFVRVQALGLANPLLCTALMRPAPACCSHSRACAIRTCRMHSAYSLHRLFRASRPRPAPPGCNDGLIPLLRLDGDSPRPDPVAALYEERRLFYVSLTRAKQRLRLSHTRQSTHFGRTKR